MYVDVLLHYNMRREDLLDVIQALEEFLPESEAVQPSVWDPDDTQEHVKDGWYTNKTWKTG